MKKLFLQSGTLWYNEFPAIQTNAMSALSVLNECEAEAAKAHSERNGLSMNIKANAYNSFLAGASFAEKEKQHEIDDLKADRDYWQAEAWELLKYKKEKTDAMSEKEEISKVYEANRELQAQLDHRDATIKELQESNEGIKQTNIEAYDRVKQLQEEITRLQTTMIAAAEEIQEHWKAHCDEDGYGPANLMHRLEKGVSSGYPGYNAGQFTKMEQENQRLKEALKHLLHNAALMRTVAENPASLLSESYENARKLIEP